MKLTINTDILSKRNISLGEFLVLLLGYYNIDYDEVYGKLAKQGIIQKNLFKEFGIILSDNTKELIAKIITESDDRITNSKINFEGLAEKLRKLYPDGNKAGTSYSWRGTTEEIAQKLKALVVVHNFTFTEEEAIEAVKDYISSFNDYKYMSLLKYFILRTNGLYDFESLFMTTIENNRECKE